MLAFVALRDGCVTNEDELREHARRRLADLKVPEKILFLEKLPKGINGKIQRAALKQIAVSGGVVRCRNPRLTLWATVRSVPRNKLHSLIGD
jgi:acyl-coenzyme A synthetase/AMP-(fatty) acid ligase